MSFIIRILIALGLKQPSNNTVYTWLARMWQQRKPADLLSAYQVTFSTLHGSLVLQDLLDNVYCTVYEGIDPTAALAHNARRSVVHEILENLDRARQPNKYIESAIEEKKEWVPGQT